MKTSRLTRGALVAAVSGLALTLTACGGSNTSSDAAAGTTSDSSSSAATSSSSAATSSGAMAASQPFGAGCSAVPASGAGSFQGMSTDPVATAASNNPVLSTLVSAVKAANLVDTLNSAQDITVFAPANPAFDAVGSDAVNALVADVPQLTTVLTHHVVSGRLSPDQLAGQHTTLNNDMITVSGSGESFTLSGEQTLTGKPANVICGNVQTANATVYIIDQVLKPGA